MEDYLFTIRKYFKKFVSSYVLCNSCKSLNTIIKRHNNTRLNILFCNNCRSEKCI